MSDLKELILSRVNIADLIGQYVPLIANGTEFKACCPFHQEKTPSFTVVPNKGYGFYYCFGCQAKGNVIDFTMQQENMDFMEAMLWLADRYSIEVPKTPGQKQERSLKQKLKEINQEAQRFYSRKLYDPEGELARKYIRQRGIDAEVAKRFELGYAPKEWTALTDMLLARGVKASELELLGLSKPRREGGGNYDSFRHRLIFPIHGSSGDVIGFGGRALSDEDNPKYLNTSNTPLYEKSRVLYNLNRARGLAQEQGLVVTEGYMDVIGLAQYGVDNTVATCGTALTSEHVEIISKLTQRVFLAFDGDNAGRSAAWKAGKLFLAAGMDARIVVIPGGMDPDDFVKERGSAAWKGLLSEARGVVQFWLEHQLAAHPDADLTMKRNWIAELRPLWRGIKDQLMREEIRRQLSDLLLLRPEIVGPLLSGEAASPRAGRGIDKEKMARDRYRQLQRTEKRKGLVQIRPGLTEDLEDSESRHRAGMIEGARNRATMQGSLPLEREVLRRLVNDEEFRFSYTRLAEQDWFQHPLHREVYAALLERQENPDGLIHDERWSGFFYELLGRSGEGELAVSANVLITRHRNLYLERCLRELMRELRQAEQHGNSERVQELTMQMIDTKRRIQPVQGIGGTGQ